MATEGGWRVRLAWGIAIAADFIQIVAFPVLWPGAVSLLDDALDLVVAGSLIFLLGWHWAFLPSFIVKLTPVLDIVPSWSAAVFLALRKPEESILPTVVPVVPVVPRGPKLLPPETPPASAPPPAPLLEGTMGPAEPLLRSPRSPGTPPDRR